MRKDVKIGAIIGGVIIGGVIVSTIVASIGHHRAKQTVKLDVPNPSPAGPANPGGPAISQTPATPTAPDHTDTASVPAHDPASDPAPAAPAGPTVTPATPATPEVPAVASGDPNAPIPAPEPPVARNSANWAALLSADHVEGDLQPVRTRTPAPAPVDSAPAAPPVVEEPVVDPHPGPGNTEVASASGNGNGAGAQLGSAPADSAPAPAKPGKTHKIVSGETFSSISRAVYGDAKYYREIIKANPTVDPTHLKLGTVITLPDPAQFKRAAKPAEKAASTSSRHAAAAPVDPKTEYRVQSTDSLYKISLKLYGNPNKVDALYQLNKDLIGSDPAKLKLNMVLKLPEAPVESGRS